MTTPAEYRKAYVAKKRAAGLCRQCGLPVMPGSSTFCPAHRMQVLKQARKRIGKPDGDPVAKDVHDAAVAVFRATTRGWFSASKMAAATGLSHSLSYHRMRKSVAAGEAERAKHPFMNHYEFRWLEKQLTPAAPPATLGQPQG